MNKVTAALLGLASVCLVAGCSPAEDDGDGARTPMSGASATPTLDPSSTGRMELDNRSYSPGDLLSVSWPGEDTRGVAYSLDAWDGSEWRTVYYLSAVSPGFRPKGDPTWWDADATGYGWVDVGVTGPGPDAAILPDTAATGTYRLCTANSPEQSCVVLTVD
ncbi:hypothetical protein [Nocardioides taihuensis]|uniref:Secreted protein n=1 Tax=Nocardioides taihuensis TaxID=1835606 RepID=A0ABW0BEG9_9ACTN